MELESDDSILKHIKDVIGSEADSFSILEHQVDVKVQMEYFEFSRNYAKDATDEELIESEPKLYDETTTADQLRSLLVGLAGIDTPEAYRILERYFNEAHPEHKDWAAMALQESRMLIESRLLDEHQVFISTGLGGKNGMLRYYVVIFPTASEEFTPTQRKLIKSEFELALRQYEGEVEEVEFKIKYTTLLAIVPLTVPVKEPFQRAIHECNTLGEFIKSSFLVTNVKILNEEEIMELISDPPPEKENT